MVLFSTIRCVVLVNRFHYIELVMKHIDKEDKELHAVCLFFLRELLRILHGQLKDGGRYMIHMLCPQLINQRAKADGK